MSKIPQNKYNCDLVVAREPEVIYTLRRINDGLTKTGSRVQYIEWNEDRSFKARFDTIAVGRSMVLDFNMGNFKWMTTQVTEILESTATYIKFKTKNSEYELYTIEHDSKTTD
jgi:hypothetical protein